MAAVFVLLSTVLSNLHVGMHPRNQHFLKLRQFGQRAFGRLWKRSWICKILGTK